MRFPVIEYKDASEQVKATYDDILKYHSFVPNWYKTQATIPTILKGNWEKVKATLYQGIVPLVLKQLVIWSISKARQCHYCETMQSMATNALGSELSHDPGFQLTTNLDSPHLPKSYKTAVDVLTEVAMDPLKTADAHYDALRDEGFSEVEIRELFAQVGLAILFNTFADISGVMVDEEALSSN